MTLKKSQKSLKAWGKQKWGTKSGKPSTQGPKATGERYLPKKAINSLSSVSSKLGIVKLSLTIFIMSSL